MRINFNSLNLGLSGGNRFIFELSNALVDRGYKVTITHAGLKKYYSWWKPNPVKAKIIDCGFSIVERAWMKALHHKPTLNQRLEMLKSYIPECDVNVATFCFTAYPTVDSRKGKGFYLVQNYEPWFFTDRSEQFLAKGTYSLPLKKLCVSHWLTEKVGGEYIGNGINLKKFRFLNISQAKANNVMLVVRKNIGWKHPELTESLAQKLKLKNMSVLQATGQLSDTQLVTMYNCAGVLVYLSEKEGFGYPPLEAMACGCQVISADCAEYLVNGKNAYVLDKGNVADLDLIVSLAQDLLKHPNEQLIKGGLETAKEYDFKYVVDLFEEEIKK